MSNTEKLCDIVSEVTGVPAAAIASDPTSLNGRIDSLDMTEIILEVEEAFDLIVENEEAIHGINDLFKIVNAEVA